MFLLTACLSYAHAQQESDSVALTNIKEIAAPGIDTTIYNNVEKMPSFPGGEFKMYEFLAMNIRYPQRAREDGYSGTVYVRFVVEPCSKNDAEMDSRRGIRKESQGYLHLTRQFQVAVRPLKSNT